MDDPKSTMSTTAHFIEQLHADMSSPHEKELITTRLLGIARARKEARTFIGSHSQAMPLFISILRNGTRVAKTNVAATLSALCKEEDLRVKVLLGGCIPPLLSLLQSESTESRRAAAEAIYEVSCGGLSDDHVGMKIFVTEGVVPTLWDQLNPKIKQDKVVEGFITGALRNLCGDKDGHWKATLEAGGVDIIVGLLSSDNAVAQSNAASLLARLMFTFSDCIPKVIDAGAVEVLLRLVSKENDISVRASASDALEALSSDSTRGKTAVVDAGGIPVLIGAVVAPSKERMQGECAQALQGHAIRALANICGGMSSLILYLGELSQAPRLAAPVADIIGTLAYSLMIFEQTSSTEEEPFDETQIEDILVMLLKPRDNKPVQHRVLEALACLYGNTYLSRWLNHADAKSVLIGLITMASADVQEYLILSFISLCCDGVDPWEALGKKEGVQLLISFLGLSSEQHQEYAVAMLVILTDHADDSKWAITAAGGIPPLVQLLEVGSQRAREDAAHVLWNLCCHSEDICACVESAGAIPALLWLLKSGSPKGQEASARALRKLIRLVDSDTIDQLLALLLGDTPQSKEHIIRVLGHALTMAPQEDLVQKGTPANKILTSLVQFLNSSNKETQEYATSVLADLFNSRQDICDSLAADNIVLPCKKILTNEKETQVAKQSTPAQGELSCPTKAKAKTTNKMPCIAERDVKALIKLAKTASIDAAETALTALADLLSDPQIAAEALEEDVVSALTRVLGEGSLEGKKNASRALHQLLNHFPVEDVLTGDAQCRFLVLALVNSLTEMDMDGNDSTHALEAVAILARTKQSVNFTKPPWAALLEVPSSLEPLVHCLADGLPRAQDKVIEILSRLCGDQPVVLGDLLVANPRAIVSLANRIMNSSSLQVRVGGAALLTCAAKEHKQQSMDALAASGFIKPLIYALVDMMKHDSSCRSLEIKVRKPRDYMERTRLWEGNKFDVPDPATVLGGTVPLWLLAIISSFNAKNKIIVKEAGGLEALSDKLGSYTANPQAKFEDTEGIWISALLLAILFQDANVALSPATMRIIPLLALLLKSDKVIDRYFATQAMASLVSSGNKGIQLGIANSGAVAGLLTLIGYIELDMPKLVTLSEEFSLLQNPDQVVLDHLFRIKDVRTGPIALNLIPLLVDLLRPMPDRPGAPSIAVHLLTHIAGGKDAHKLAMAEAGALDALAKYLSLSPKDTTETTISELLRILYSNPDVVRHEASLSSLNQLIAVLHLGSRSARLSAVGALQELFDYENIRDTELARQAIQPLVEMLNTGLEREQQEILVALIKLTSGSASKASYLADVEGDPLEMLYKILASSSSLELKKNAAQLCFVLFGNPKVRAMPIATECIQFLISLMQSDTSAAVESGVCAFERLLDDEQQVEFAAAHNVVDLLVGLVAKSNNQITEASINALIKLGKDHTPCKLDMVKAGIIDRCLELLPSAPGSLCSSIAKLFRVLTNNSGIAKSSAAMKMLEPLFMALQHQDISISGQHSALQTLVNILEKPENLATLKLTPSQVIKHLITLLKSPSQTIQQLGTELLSHLLAVENFQEDITTQNAIVPIVQLAGTGKLNVQQTAIKALESISTIWPKAVADAGGIFELSKIIIQDDPQPPEELLESASLVLSNILKIDTEYYYKVSLEVLVKMLHSVLESTVTVALNALIVLERSDPSSAELMVDAGAIDLLMDLLTSHQCEEASGRLLEALFNNERVRKKKVCRYAIAPLSQYLLDPQTKSETGKFLAAIALGDLSQYEVLARASDSTSACHALISLLEDQPNEDMKTVVICALQNFVVHSRTNRRVVAEAGGILVLEELLLSPNPDIAAQTALLIKLLFSNHTLQEYVSNELIGSLTATLEKEWSTPIVYEEVLRTIHVMFSNFTKLHNSEAATLCIPHLIGLLKAGSEAAQESTMMKCPPRFHEKAESLLHCLPGCLTVTIKRGNNLKNTVGNMSAFCRLTIGNCPPRHTKVVSHTTSPEWQEEFTWAFDVPPKGQMLHIACKNKNTFGQTTLGTVTIQIDKVVFQGEYSGIFNLNQNGNKKEEEKDKDGSSRTLEIDITWSNKMPNEKASE
ncbi:PREDICTED: uncharacterized protein LOC104587550 isoform X2 [Nelumbo nucifera]|uniref:Uncharacterized protein LOC104587550 isoform X2 n=1 Tax=Nelumbo nucifera TaxID=4432 RepID=A0A1U7Z7F4_NELNU|nr:PREDICTED: uncharacterized protein LOC104587550 isoform X2 [Nelumbo nucifera]